MANNRKTITVKEMFRRLDSGKVSLPPLHFRLFTKGSKDGSLDFDTGIEASWSGIKAKFVVECKALSTPKAFQAAKDRLKNANLPRDYLPMVFLPYLNDDRLLELEREGLSGIDMCGNGVVIVPGRFSVFRGGADNLFPSSAPIKNVYRKKSSLVGRIFLANTHYCAVQGILDEINSRNPLIDGMGKIPMSLSTVSKVLKTLEDDLIITREDDICLLQPDKLLENLVANYTPPLVGKRESFKIPDGASRTNEILKQARSQGMPVVATGLSSVSQYAVMQRGDVLSVYCPDIENLAGALPGDRTDRFSNLELIETDDETVFFDPREDENFWWASPVQTFLELMAGDKRDRETAEQVKSVLLREVEGSRR